MERLFRDKTAPKLGGGLKDRPLCEHCGRPVKISSNDYVQEEVLCAACAAEARISDYDEGESG